MQNKILNILFNSINTKQILILLYCTNTNFSEIKLILNDIK